LTKKSEQESLAWAAHSGKTYFIATRDEPAIGAHGDAAHSGKTYFIANGGFVAGEGLLHLQL
jgi:hypothetical protein